MVIACGALAVLVVAGGATAASALHKNVTLDVDGQRTPVSTYALSVSDVLSSNGITLASGDTVQPATDQPVPNGGTINVTYLKKIDLTVDGKARTLTTTASTLEIALDQAAIPDNALVSVPTSTPVPRNGLDVDVVTPKNVTLLVAGKKTAVVATTSLTVGDLLTAEKVSVAAQDRVAPATATLLTNGATVTVDKVTTSTVKDTVAVPFSTTTKTDASLSKGVTKVITKGKDGKAVRTYSVTTVNGKVASKKVTAQTTVTAPVTQVVQKGTKPLPTPAATPAPSAGNTSGAGLNTANAAMWDRIAKCESGGNWSINTGNGYYGGLQFNLGTWRSAGGTQFASSPNKATREQQITVANRLYASRGLQPWGCKWAA